MRLEIKVNWEKQTNKQTITTATTKTKASKTKTKTKKTQKNKKQKTLKKQTTVTTEKVIPSQPPTDFFPEGYFTSSLTVSISKICLLSLFI